jgi:pyruvate dehydrogenase E1 component alpha subunit
MRIPRYLEKVKEINWTKEQLEQFELEAKTEWETGNVLGPVHLSKGNEEQLIKIFQYVHPDDWVFSTWRNHYHALLHGVPGDWLMDEIKRGRSMKIFNKEHNFVISAIVGGPIPQALGVAMALKRKGSKRRVWCFVGDMAFETGEFHLCYKYAKNFDLPLQFVVEDNNLSTNTPTDETWGVKQKVPEDVIYYEYERGFPHHGSGTWVLF